MQAPNSQHPCLASIPASRLAVNPPLPTLTHGHASLMLGTVTHQVAAAMAEAAAAAAAALPTGITPSFLSHDWMCAGEYIAHRLLELGVRQYYTVAGDFNLSTLDAMAKVPSAGTTSKEV